MRIRLLALLILIAVLLSGCGYWVIEETPIQIGNSAARESILNNTIAQEV